jgi:hypothetical protein
LTVILWRRFTSQAARAALGLLLVLQALPLWTAYPDYLAYFNFTAGKHPENILIDSDLDWGQDLKRLQQRLVELHVTKFGFVYRGSADVVGERLPGVWMVQPFNPTTGWVAASIFARDTVSQGQAFGWLKQYQPIERIGKSIDLYFIPESPGRIGILAGEEPSYRAKHLSRYRHIENLGRGGLRHDTASCSRHRVVSA